mmetsp:Transcript_13691/g.25673  ORF Transcript_13691/g.25673 Transcript_13691/m.25673 type:complete len:89 (-) Transcript_13691:97-363(-)
MILTMQMPGRLGMCLAWRLSLVAEMALSWVAQKYLVDQKVANLEHHLALMISLVAEMVLQKKFLAEQKVASLELCLALRISLVVEMVL